jgi:hypothetical protein
VFFLLFGSSAAGKTYALDRIRGRVDRLAVFDFNDLGAPVRPGRDWRHRTLEAWVRRAVELQEQGMDALVAGQAPFGELLAAPSTPQLEAVAGCLLDCDDATRTSRLEARGSEFFEEAGGTIEQYLGWAAWLRGHALDPRHHREVIEDGADLAFGRFAGWRAGDRHWQVPIIDTGRPAELVVADITDWIADERRLLTVGQHPLAGWAASIR